MHRSDPTLINACLGGKQAAWETLVERYQRLVYSIPRRYGMSDSDADDVFQNVFAAVFKNLDNLRDQTRLSSWLITTTHRECWRIGRKSKRESNIDQMIVDVSAPEVEQSLAWERQHLVRQSLEKLGGRCEQLLTALFLESGEPNYDTIATRLEIPRGSIGPTRSRCFKKLATILREEGFDAYLEYQSASSNSDEVR